MVCGHEPLLFVAPLEQGEINNPQTFELVFVSQSKSVAHFQTQGTQLHTGLVGLVATQDEHEVAIVGTHGFLELLEHLGAIEFVDAALYRAVVIELHPYQTFGTYLRTLHKVGQLVNLLAGIRGTSGHTDTANVFSLVEHAKLASTLEHIHQFDELHAKAKVGFVAAKTAHGLMP